jgi:hypothetical protein
VVRRRLMHVNFEKQSCWEFFLEENRKLSQGINGHPGTEKTQIQTKAIEDQDLVLTRKKPNIGKGRSLRDYVVEKGIPCAEEIQLGRCLINLWRS